MLIPSKSEYFQSFYSKPGHIYPIFVSGNSETCIRKFFTFQVSKASHVKECEGKFRYSYVILRKDFKKFLICL